MGGIAPAGDVGLQPSDDAQHRDAAARSTRSPAADTAGHATAAHPSADRRPSYNRRLYVELCRSTDVVVALLVLGAVFLIANAGETSHGWRDFLLIRLNLLKLLELGVFAFLWQQIFRVFGLYETSRTPSLREEAPRIVAACGCGAITSIGFAFLSESGAFHPAIPLFALPPMVLATLSARFTMQKVAERSSPRASRRVLVVGSGPLAHRLYGELTRHGAVAARELVGFVDSNPDIRYAEIRTRLVGRLDQLEQILMHLVVDEVFVALPIKSHYATIQRVIEVCERAGVQCRYSPEVFRTTIASARLDPSDPLLAVALHVSPDDERMLVKRAIDIAGAAIGLALTAPAWALIAIAIKATSPGPVFFVQERYGWRKRRFRMLKFRTMVSDAEELQQDLEDCNEAVGPIFKMTDDPRVTRVGHLLRKSSLDELPQLWNVLRGDMSLVGPRPLPMRDVRRFNEVRLMRRFSVAPGMTGLWQISGRSAIPFDEWIALDLEYIDRWSLTLDLRILLRTIPAVLRGTGAS